MEESDRKIYMGDLPLSFTASNKVEIMAIETYSQVLEIQKEMNSAIHHYFDYAIKGTYPALGFYKTIVNGKMTSNFDILKCKKKQV